jgi:hypothetical protein
MALIGTLTDNFNDNSIDGAKWGTTGIAWSETNSQLEGITALAGSDDYFYSATTYDLTGSQATIKIVDAGNQSLASFAFDPLWLNRNADNAYIRWRITSGNITAEYSGTGVLATASYVSATHKYLRIRESGGNTYWDYSSDGITWTNFYNASNPMTVINFEASVHVYSTLELSTTTAKVDNFNLLPTLTDRTTTKLLCHFEGADAATTYTSDDVNARVATFAGSAQLDTAIKEAGTASLLLASATSDYLTFPDSDDWELGTGDYTVDGWFYFTSLPTNGNSMCLLSQYQDANNLFLMSLSCVDATPYYRLEVVANTGGAWQYIQYTSWQAASVFPTGKFIHIAFVRSSGATTVYVNGIEIGFAGTDTEGSVGNYAAPIKLGSLNSADYLNGQIDELRIVKGTAIWTANFTPPVEYYLSAAATGIGFFFGVSP